ncbi:MAG: hydrogenase nickel incorporation protein HypB [Acidobacteriota bacterium]
MCETCGCGLSGEAKGEARKGHDHDPGHGHSPDGRGGRREEVLLYRNLMESNDRTARANREHLLEHHVLAVNLMSGPGAGKTALLEALVGIAGGSLRLGAIEGDLATDRDAVRLRALGIPVHAVTTGSTCHLDAAMVHEALHALPLGDLDILFVENVGNLVCPGLYDLGCHLNGVLLSVTEGDDKVAKYPVAFRNAQFFCLTKTDLLPHVAFDAERPRREARLLKGDLRLFACSAREPETVEPLLEYFREARRLLL